MAFLSTRCELLLTGAISCYGIIIGLGKNYLTANKNDQAIKL